MKFYVNGFVVAKMNNKDSSDIPWPLSESFYIPWPLADLTDDKMAQELTKLADDNWFSKYHMQEIAPDSTYIKLYLDYCSKIELDVKVLLFESLDDTIIVDDKFELCEVLGYDCMGYVGFSYLQTEYYQYPEMHKKGILQNKYGLLDNTEMHKKGILQNKYGLLDNIEDVLYFIKLRQQTIADGINIESFWEEILVRISVVNVL